MLAITVAKAIPINPNCSSGSLKQLQKFLWVLAIIPKSGNDDLTV